MSSRKCNAGSFLSRIEVAGGGGVVSAAGWQPPGVVSPTSLSRSVTINAPVNVQVLIPGGVAVDPPALTRLIEEKVGQGNDEVVKTITAELRSYSQ